MKKKTMLIIALMCLIGFNTACDDATHPIIENSQENENSLVDTKWKLVGYSGVDKIYIGANPSFTLYFDTNNTA